ncbi:HNH endonuclease [Prosthecobacter sp.]|uniref:HNH endonuclease n=1 Tax=Prosthecobacter sp. TaxID=1965333 RepID=UPI003783767C
MSIPNSLRWQVIERAMNRCEYCGLSQEGQEAVFHIDHIHPASLDGQTESENLALACVSCSLRKSARVSAIDPITNFMEPLFNPRRDVWNLHFRWRDCELTGITPTGRATVQALAMNRPIAVSIRREESLRDRHPPPGHL